MQAYRWIADSRVRTSSLNRVSGLIDFGAFTLFETKGPICGAAQGEAPEHNEPLPLPHHLQLYVLLFHRLLLVV